MVPETLTYRLFLSIRVDDRAGLWFGVFASTDSVYFFLSFFFSDDLAESNLIRLGTASRRTSLEIGLSSFGYVCRLLSMWF